MEHSGTKDLQLQRIIGFNGKVPAGLIVHPDREHVIYPLGCNIIIEDLTKESKQCILSCHTNNVSCIAVSHDGRYIVSGQETYMGFKADIILWDYHTKKPTQKWSLHKVKVQALAFSKNGKYLISLGGQDDGSVVVWDMASKESLCGSPAQVESAGITSCLVTSNQSDNQFVTGGENTLRVWTIDKENRKIRPENVNLGGLKRTINCIEMVDDQDAQMPYFFCGTTSGDILCINKDSTILQCVIPEKGKFSCGVTALSFVKLADQGFNMLIGTGSGLVGIYDIKVSFMNGNRVKSTLKHRKDVEPAQTSGAVTSLSKRGKGHEFYVGTDSSQIYKFQFADFSAGLLKTCHSKPVKDIVFPYGISQLALSCQEGEIRIWNLYTGKELRRYEQPNITCSSLAITQDGTTVISGWDDGKIKVFGFNGKDLSLDLKLVIKDAHNKGVKAVTVTSCGKTIISGGGEGSVRVWDLTSCCDHNGKKIMTSHLRHSMKEHKNYVSQIVLHHNNKECISAGRDGTTIIWDLQNGIRKNDVLANTLFESVCYGADEKHLVTCGSDRKIAYWDTSDGGLIRELEGTKSGAITFLDITADKKYFVSCGEDKLVKLWQYHEGEVTHVGKGHSDKVRRVRVAPDGRTIVSVSDDGAILQWQFPSMGDIGQC